MKQTNMFAPSHISHECQLYGHEGQDKTTLLGILYIETHLNSPCSCYNEACIIVQLILNDHIRSIVYQGQLVSLKFG